MLPKCQDIRIWQGREGIYDNLENLATSYTLIGIPQRRRSRISYINRLLEVLASNLLSKGACLLPPCSSDYIR
jgi:hypothetical protein